MLNIKVEQIDKDGEILNWRATDNQGRSVTSNSKQSALAGLEKLLFEIEHKIGIFSSEIN